MAIPIKMPKLSDTMTEGTVVKWRKREGDRVASGDIIAEIETDKATMDLEVFDEGVVLKILVAEGTVAPCNQPIAVVGEPGESPEVPAGAPVERKEAAAKAVAAAMAPPPAPERADGKIKASPLARKLAAERGISLSRLRGSGPGGRIVRKDVLGAAETAVEPRSGTLLVQGPVAKEGGVAVTNMRRTIAKRLVQSKLEYPHFYVEVEADAGPLVTLRENLNAEFASLPQPLKLSYNDLILKAAAQAVRKVPAVNSSWQGETIHQYAEVHLAFGVALPGGLITPVIRSAQDKNVAEISREASALAQRARDGKLQPAEYTGGTMTVSNLGGPFGVDRFCAIINPPQAVILAVGNILRKPVVDAQGRVVAGHRLSLTLSADHRVVDGAAAAAYLSELRRLLESPALLLV